jgi:hypothetical protein
MANPVACVEQRRIMKSKVFCGLGLCVGLGLGVSAASASPPLKVVGWGGPYPVYLAPPADLPLLIEISGGAQFVAGLDRSRKLQGWGVFQGSIPFFVPDDIGQVKLLRTSSNRVLVVTETGEVRVWGSEIDPELDLAPEAAMGAVDVGLGFRGAIALTTDGSVIVWGSGPIVDNFPPDLGLCIEVSAVADTATAVTAQGEIRCWGSEAAAYTCPAPASLGPVVEAVSVGAAAVALDSTGRVVH